MNLKTERLDIRPFRPDDWKDLHEYLSLPEIYTFEPGEPVDEDGAQRLALERSQGEDFLAVVVRDTDKMVGHVYLGREQPEFFLCWELGFIFNPAYQRRGYCTEACKAVRDYSFDVLGAHRLVAGCSPDNPASWRVLEKIGMRREGVFLKNAYFRRGPDGEPLWFDSWHYAILESDPRPS
ncbi:MAG: GNAT family N-acetyltransferase [Thermoleophilia bacterium]|nr:GNAT family N-acetyltransferase [Thermoleophilia bacterium]